jgi:hypothetical protein
MLVTEGAKGSLMWGTGAVAGLKELLLFSFFFLFLTFFFSFVCVQQIYGFGTSNDNSSLRYFRHYGLHCPVLDLWRNRCDVNYFFFFDFLFFFYAFLFVVFVFFQRMYTRRFWASEGQHRKRLWKWGFQQKLKEFSKVKSNQNWLENPFLLFPNQTKFKRKFLQQKSGAISYNRLIFEKKNNKNKKESLLFVYFFSNVDP